MKKANVKLTKKVTTDGKPAGAYSSFTTRVLAVVARIPRGSVLTYWQVAERVGSPLGSRAVGTVLSKNYNPKVPCHRVVRSDGKVGGYNRGAVRKRELLVEEGAMGA
jgi:O-6-methylguanine DNA methyltransferase